MVHQACFPQRAVDGGNPRDEEKKRNNFSPTQHWRTRDLIQPSIVHRGGKWRLKRWFHWRCSLLRFPDTPCFDSVLYTWNECSEISWIVVSDGLRSQDVLDLSVHSTCELGDTAEIVWPCWTTVFSLIKKMGNYRWLWALNKLSRQIALCNLGHAMKA